MDTAHGNSRCECFLDTFALSRARLWEGICDAVRACVAQGEHTLVIAHFPATFGKAEQVLATAGLPFAISPPRVTWDWLSDWILRSPPQIILTLAGALSSEIPARSDPAIQQRLAVIVAERFPHPVPDRLLVEFFKRGAVPSQLGYYVALDDPTFASAGHDLLVEVMQQLGLDHQSLVSSQLLSRRLQRVLSQRARHLSSWQPADSAEAWLAAHPPK